MRRSISPSRARRRGQALLLAVLIMIFAALLSAAFIAVVSANLNQTARQSDKNRAITAANAGLDYVNRQLAFSDDGDRWFDKNYPTSTLATYSTTYGYYSALDTAQGWAGNFAKFPNPLTETEPINPRQSGTRFLAKVDRIAYNLKTTDPDYARAGSLRITIIGLSADDPTAWNKIVAYKGDVQHSPLGQEMRVVSNWDFKSGTVPTAQVGAYDTTTNTITLANTRGTFPDAPFGVMIGDPTAGKGVRGATVVASTATTLVLGETLSTPPTPAATGQTAERVQLAATLGSPLAIDYNNDGTPDPTAEPVNFSVSDPSATPIATATPLPGGIRANGGLWMSGTVSANNLHSDDAAARDARVQASGAIALNTGAVVTLADQATNTTATLVDSDTGSFPGTGTLWPATLGASGRDLFVSDGWNRMKGVVGDGTRNVHDFIPPNISSGEGLERYRNLTRFSAPSTLFPQPTAPLYGYGSGIYIDNASDKEKVGTAEMSQAQLVSMWLSSTPTTTTDFQRTGPPALPASTTASLEEQHLRGWISPDEFQARGVLIELVNHSSGPPTISITRDARTDNTATPAVTTNALGPVDEKAWKNPATGAVLKGVYTQDLPWPSKGVIMAEGNIRIKGVVANAPCSLTVVSMNNIYIEDSLQLVTSSGTARKISLLAKKNVVVNPTQVLSSPDIQTVVNTGGTAIPVTVGPTTPATVTVADGTGFHIGDVIETTNPATVAGAIDTAGQITAMSGTKNVNLTVQVLYASTATIVDGSAVRTRHTLGTTMTPALTFGAVGKAEDAIQRRFNLQTVPATLRLAFNHQGDRLGNATTSVFKVATKTPTAPPGYTPPANSIYFGNKRVLTISPMPILDPTKHTVNDLNKLIQVDFSDPATGKDTFPSAPPMDNMTANAVTLQTLASAMNGTAIHAAGPPPTMGWQYDVTLNPSYAALPFFYLAGVGNRYNYGPVVTTDFRPDIKVPGPTTAYESPLATSIGFWINGQGPATHTQTPLISDEVSTTFTTNQFGFDPLFQDVTANPMNAQEDLLTGDQSFYQTNPTQTTLDSRKVLGMLAGQNSLTLRQSDNLIGVTTAAALPTYRLRGIKLENTDLTTGALEPGHTIDIGAFVYAQQGSWFIIPGPTFNPDVKVRGDQTKSYIDLNDNKTADAGEWADGTAGAAGTFDAGDGADLNRNGLVDPGEVDAAIRFDNRYNYQINFTGAIAENQTALVNTATFGATTAYGAVQDWMDKWSTETYKVTPAASFNRSRIQYVFDPAIANGSLQDDPSTTTVDETDPGFHLPQTTQLYDIS